MLDHLQAHDGVEGRSFRLQLLHPAGAIVDLESLAGGMAAGRLDRLRRRVETRHPRTQARQRLGNEPPAAAHIQHPQARERPQPAPGQGKMADHLVAQEREPRRADAMQRAELAVGVPPFAGEPREAVDLAGIERPGSAAWSQPQPWRIGALRRGPVKADASAATVAGSRPCG